MKRIFLFSLLLIIGLGVNISCSNQRTGTLLPNYPSYKVVATKFLQEYSIADIEYPHEFKLAKKPDGWHAMHVDAYNKVVVKDELFWKRSKKKYQDVDFLKGENDMKAKNIQQIINNSQNNYFTKISPFWGYEGWDKDVIDEYESNKNLSDTLLNSLARAYCSFASNLLNNNTGFSKDALRYDLPKGQNSLSEEQLAHYREIEHKGIETYYKLWECNPEFENFVADAYNIYSNEILNSYLTILYHQNAVEAGKELKDGLFDDFFIDMAKKYLSSCDSNAILVVNGDSDTFPLLYVQENEGFRKDVTVVNFTMMGSGRYVSYLLGDKNTAGQISCSLDKDLYQDDEHQVFYVKEQIASAELSTVLDFIASEDLKTKIEIGGNYYDYIPTRSLTLDYNRDDIPMYSELYGSKDSDVDEIFRIKLNNNYVLRNQLCFLDIVATNAFQRPVYFSASSPKDSYLGLEDYFQKEGLTYKLMPHKVAEQVGGIYTGYINIKIQYDKLMSTFVELQSESQQYFDIHRKMVSIYRMNYSQLAERLIEENRYDKALEVLDYINDTYPSAKVPHNYFSLSMIESYYKMDRIEEGNAIVEDMMNASEETINTLGSEESDSYVTIAILNQLKDITMEYLAGSAIQEKVAARSNLLLEKFE